MVIVYCLFFFFFKQKTAYEMRISDWSSDVCSSDLALASCGQGTGGIDRHAPSYGIAQADPDRRWRGHGPIPSLPHDQSTLRRIARWLPARPERLRARGHYYAAVAWHRCGATGSGGARAAGSRDAAWQVK